MDGHVVGPRLASHHVGYSDVAAFEFAGGGVHQPVLLRLPVDGAGTPAGVLDFIAQKLIAPLT